LVRVKVLIIVLLEHSSISLKGREAKQLLMQQLVVDLPSRAPPGTTHRPRRRLLLGSLASLPGLLLTVAVAACSGTVTVTIVTCSTDRET
jgi:hypothetical protein